MGASLTWAQSGTSFKSLSVCGQWKWSKNLCKVLGKCPEFPVGKSSLLLPVSLRPGMYWEVRDAAWEARPLAGCSKAFSTLPPSVLLCCWLTTWYCCRGEALKQLNLSHCLSLLENLVLLLLPLLPSLLWLTSLSEEIQMALFPAMQVSCWAPPLEAKRGNVEAGTHSSLFHICGQEAGCSYSPPCHQHEIITTTCWKHFFFCFSLIG